MGLAWSKFIQTINLKWCLSLNSPSKMLGLYYFACIFGAEKKNHTSFLIKPVIEVYNIMDLHVPPRSSLVKKKSTPCMSFLFFSWKYCHYTLKQHPLLFFLLSVRNCVNIWESGITRTTVLHCNTCIGLLGHTSYALHTSSTVRTRITCLRHMYCNL